MAPLNAATSALSSASSSDSSSYDALVNGRSVRTVETAVPDFPIDVGPDRVKRLAVLGLETYVKHRCAGFEFLGGGNDVGHRKLSCCNDPCCFSCSALVNAIEASKQVLQRIFRLLRLRLRRAQLCQRGVDRPVNDSPSLRVLWTKLGLGAVPAGFEVLDAVLWRG